MIKVADRIMSLAIIVGQCTSPSLPTCSAKQKQLSIFGLTFDPQPKTLSLKRVNPAALTAYPADFENCFLGLLLQDSPATLHLCSYQNNSENSENPKILKSQIVRSTAETTGRAWLSTEAVGLWNDVCFVS